MNNLLVVISGPSGGGKGTIIKTILSRGNPKYMQLCTFTTRPRRQGELDGEQYRFISQEDYDVLDKSNRVMAKNLVDGYSYRSTSNRYVRSKLTRKVYYNGYGNKRCTRV